MADTGLVCWKCGAAVADQPLPLARLAECTRCRAQLHVCRMCEFHDRSYSHACRETVADEVPDKERANFCGYFKARPGAFQGGDDAAASRARAELEALFGGGASGSSPDSASELERLFGKRE